MIETEDEGIDIVFRLALMQGTRELRSFNEFTLHVPGPIDGIDIDEIIRNVADNMEPIHVHSRSWSSCTRENRA